MQKGWPLVLGVLLLCVVVCCLNFFEIVIYTHKQQHLSIDMKTKIVQHVPTINISIWHKTCDMWHATCDMWHNHKYSLLSIDMKTKVVQHVPRINISIVTCEMWHNYKYSLWSIDMKTKVVQDIPGINISIWHIWHAKCDMINPYSSSLDHFTQMALHVAWCKYLF